MTASELYALTQGFKCEGPDQCYWCGAPCPRLWQHEQPPWVLGVKRNPWVKRPGNAYICVGCKLFRRPRITVPFLGGGYKDSQCPEKHSWWITDAGAWAIRKESYESLYEVLLAPPERFCLMLTETVNRPQIGVVNDPAWVQAGTVLAFTMNNVEFKYSVYELEIALKQGCDGVEPGVRELVKLLGPYRVMSKQEKEVQEEKRGRGRPSAPKHEEHDSRILKKIVKQGVLQTSG